MTERALDACAGRRRRGGPGRRTSREPGHPTARRAARRRRPGRGGGDRPVHDGHGREPAVGLSRPGRGADDAARGARTLPGSDLRVERSPRRVRRRHRGGARPRRRGEAEVLAAEVRGRGAAVAKEATTPTRCGTRPPRDPSTTELVLWGKPGEVALPGRAAAADAAEHAGPGHRPARRPAGARGRLSFPAALLKRALGEYVDPLEMSLSEVQSAFIAPVGAGLTTHSLAGPELALTSAPATEPAQARQDGRPGDSSPPTPAARPARPGPAGAPRRSRMVVRPGEPRLRGRHASAGVRRAEVVPSAHASQQAAARRLVVAGPTVTRTQSTLAPTRTPNVTLKSDLAFGFNSSTLSPEAKVAIAPVADQVRTGRAHREDLRRRLHRRHRVRGVRARPVAAPGRRRLHLPPVPAAGASRSRSCRSGTARRTRSRATPRQRARSRTAGSPSRLPEP